MSVSARPNNGMQRAALRAAADAERRTFSRSLLSRYRLLFRNIGGDHHDDGHAKGDGLPRSAGISPPSRQSGGWRDGLLRLTQYSAIRHGGLSRSSWARTAADVQRDVSSLAEGE